MKTPDDSRLPEPTVDQVRRHSYDGIQEYDNSLPNWWLWTLYITIIFSFGYWFYHFTTTLTPSDEERMATAMAMVEEARLAAVGELSDEVLWQMSRNANIVETGRLLYMGQGTCFSCHGANLEGGIGVALADDQWVWGNNPMSVYAIIDQGSPDTSKGMIGWGPILGADKVKQITAYILSHHTEASMAAASTDNPPIAY